MTFIKSIEIVAISMLFIACSSLKTTSYFKLCEGEVQTYSAFFVKDSLDSNYKKIEKVFGSISVKDSIFLQLQIVYKTMDIEGHKAFYALDVEDTLYKNPIIGSNHFLSSALIFKDDTVLLAPVFKKRDLEKIKLSDFKYAIPPIVKPRDSIVIIDRERTMIIRNFNKMNLTLKNINYNNCLVFDVVHIWPGIIYN